MPVTRLIRASDNLQEPWLGQGFPLYPQISQVVRVYTPKIFVWQATVVNDAATVSGSPDLASTEMNFQPSDVGDVLTGSTIDLGTVISSIIDSSHALMSKPAVGTTTGTSVLKAGGLGLPSAPTGNLISGSKQLATLAPTFTPNDLGAIIAGPDIPFGTVIANVDSPIQAEMSQPATASASGVTLMLVPANIPSTFQLGFIQQWNPLLTLRDREPCLVWEPNGIHLNNGYYDARLVGSCSLLPLLVTWCCP
jgi:hypothetical protein